MTINELLSQQKINYLINILVHKFENYFTKMTTKPIILLH